MQVFVDLNGGGMITIFPERTPRCPALVVLLRGALCDELHTLSNYVWAGIFDQEMNVVGRHRVIEHAQTKAFLRLEHPMQVTAAVARFERSGILPVSLLNG